MPGSDPEFTSDEIADISPYVGEDSQLVAHFADIVFEHLRTSNYAKGRIKEATTIDNFGMLTRLFDELAKDPAFEQFSADLLANTERAAEEGNLAGYLSQFARGIAHSLFNEDMTDLSDALKETIGQDNYGKLLAVANGDTTILVAKLIQASIIFHATICSAAFNKKHGIPPAIDSVESKLTEEQTTALGKFTREVTVPSREIQTTLTVENLQTIPLPKEAVDPQAMETALSDLDALSDKISKLKEQHNDLAMLNNKLRVLEDKIVGFKDTIAEGWRPTVEQATKLATNIEGQLAQFEELANPEKSAKLEELVKLEKLAQQLGRAEIQLGNYIKALEQHKARPEKAEIVRDLQQLIATLQTVKTEIKGDFEAVLNDQKPTADLEKPLGIIKEAFAQHQESNLYNPREKSWLESILNRLVKCFSLGFKEYTPQEVKEAKTITNSAKNAISNLKNLYANPELSRENEPPAITPS